jgi:hypothetical protein
MAPKCDEVAFVTRSGGHRRLDRSTITVSGAPEATLAELDTRVTRRRDGRVQLFAEATAGGIRDTGDRSVPAMPALKREPACDIGGTAADPQNRRVGEA